MTFLWTMALGVFCVWIAFEVRSYFRLNRWTETAGKQIGWVFKDGAISREEAAAKIDDGLDTLKVLYDKEMAIINVRIPLCAATILVLVCVNAINDIAVGTMMPWKVFAVCGFMSMMGTMLLFLEFMVRQSELKEAP